jgi:hypothetical protein
MGTQNRGELAHFLADKNETAYTRLAKGFTELSSSMSPQTQEKTYIDDSSDSVTTAYQVSWAVSGDIYTLDAANAMLHALAVRRAKGDDAVVYLLVARLWEPGTNNPTKDFKGYKQKCSWVPDNDGGGAGGETVTFSGALNAKDDPVHGWITITKPPAGAVWTATFSEEEPAADV